MAENTGTCCISAVGAGIADAVIDVQQERVSVGGKRPVSAPNSVISAVITHLQSLMKLT